MTDHQNLLDLAQKGLNGGENVDEVTERLKNLAQLIGQELDDQTALELAQQLVPTDDPPAPPPPPDAPPPPPAAPPPPPAAPPPPPAAPPPPPAAPPPPPDSAEEVPLLKLAVDWGTYPEVGHMASPQFLLVCPDSYQRERPRVLVKVAENLDHTFPSDRPRTLKSEGPGKWGFNVPFTLTTNDQDCRPGYYVIHVTVEYHNLANPSLPHAFHCSIRLHITQPGSNEGRTLTIDGDGHADINLRGQDLKSFDQVILKGDERANITLHNNELLQSEETNEETEEESVTHTFELKPTFQDEPRLFIPERYKMVSPSRMEMAMFLFTDESRIMLIPKKRVTIGRNRSAQIVLRFLPRSSQHDRLSLKISRDHMTLELNNDGLLVKDRGPDRQGKQTGALKISGKVVQNGNQHLLGPEQLGGNLVVELPYGLSYEQPFKFELDLFGGEDDEMGHDQARRQQKLDLLQRAVGTQRRPPLWRLAEKNGFDAVRLRRRENLVEEKYVLLYCRGLIGNSPSSNPIHIDDRNISPETARLVYIDRSFWLQNLGPADRVKVDGQPIGPGELIPLSPGMELLFGETAVRFERFEQMHL